MCLAIPAQVVEIDPATDTATVALGEVRKQVSLALIDDVAAGDFVLVHVGYALNRISEEAAARTLAGAGAEYLGVASLEEGLALRGTFIIDPNGVLKTAEVHDLGIGRSAAETLRKLEAARFVHEHGDQVCPANWKPGADTLKPGLDLVGKI